MKKNLCYFGTAFLLIIIATQSCNSAYSFLETHQPRSIAHSIGLTIGAISKPLFFFGLAIYFLLKTKWFKLTDGFDQRK